MYNQAAQSTHSLVGEHARNANRETEATSCGPRMQPFQRSKNPTQVNQFGEESGQNQELESQGQRGKTSEIKRRVVLTLAFSMGEDQKA